MNTIMDAAIEMASAGWPVMPLRGKIPYTSHGVKDATLDPAVIWRWWGRWPRANVGIALPEHVMVIDTDPRNGGDVALDLLEDTYGELPPTLTCASGRGDGGLHRYYARPAGRITGKNLGAGVDLKHHGGYVVAPPSLHPDSGQPYTWITDLPVADPPDWLVDLIRVRPAPAKTYTPRPVSLPGGQSIADAYCAAVTWAQVLLPHGWRLLDPDPDADGARWLHPAATSSCSATVRDGCLFVWSSNTPFDQSSAGDPVGYTKFRAYAVLNHRGDLSAAAKFLNSTRKGAAA